MGGSVKTQINRIIFGAISINKDKLDSLKIFIEKYTFLPTEDWARIAACFEFKKIEKETILLKEGQVCRHLYFLEKGLLRYYIIKDGTETTKFFTDAPYCFTSQVSFTGEIPAKENIQAIEESYLYQITLSQANELLQLDSWNTFVRKLIQEVQFYTEQILEEIQTETAEFRYLKLIEQNPKLLQRIPLKYLASYYGIAPQSLSRIRKKVMGQ